MTEANSGSSDGAFPGWLPKLDLQDLVQWVDPGPRPEPSTRQTSEADIQVGIQGGPLLAGRRLQVELSPAGSAAASSMSESSEAATVTQIPVSVTPVASKQGILRKLAIASLVAVGLIIFAWAVVKRSDFSEVAVVKGYRFAEDHLVAELGETLPSFSGLLLVEEPNTWGDTFSDQDLVGRNTVLFVWGTWNEELVSWSQDLNYIRLVNFENKEVQFIGLNLDSNREDALSALNADLANWPQLFNADERKAEEERAMFRLGIRSSPLILLIDATGRLRAEGLEPGELVEVYRELFE